MDLHAVHLDGRGVGPLDAGELARGRALADPTVRHRFLAGRSWLRELVAGVSGTPPESLSAQYECPACTAVDHGRPRWTVAGQPLPVRASLSRSGGWAAAVVDGSPSLLTLGIDLEQISRFGGTEIDATVFTRGEQSEIRSRGEQEQPRLRAHLWARKEAVLKASGTGLMTDPASIDVLGPAVRVGALDYSVRDVQTASLELPDGFVVALAVSR
jgi:4'-phosphopantetheinyl transferase